MDEILGSLGYEITGDWSDLQQALSDAEGAATATGEEIASALNIPDAGQGLTDSITAMDAVMQQAGVDAAGSGQEISDALSQVDSSAADTSGIVSDAMLSAADSIQEAGNAAEQATGHVHELGQAGHDAAEGGHEAHEAWEQFGEALALLTGVELTIEGLKELGTEAIAAFSSVQKASIALTALQGSADKTEESIARLKELAISDALSFPQLVQGAQKMAAFKVSLEEVPGALQAAGDAAAATGNDFSNVAGAMEKMALSGNAGAKQLVQLGLSLSDLAEVMHVSDDEAKQAFKDLPDTAARLNVLTEALTRFKGIAQLEAQTIAGQWQILKTQWDLAFESLGADLAGAVLALEKFAQQAALFIRASLDMVGSLETLIGALVRLAATPLPSWMKEGSAGVFKSIGDSWLVIAAASGAIADAVTNSGAQINTMQELVQHAMENTVHIATTSGQQFKDAWAIALDQANHSATVLGQGSLDLLSKIKDLNDEVTRSHAVYNNLNAAFQAGTVLANGQTVTIQAVRQAWNDYHDALAKADIQTKVNKDSIEALVVSFAKAQTAFTTTVTEFQRLSDGFNAGRVSAGLLIEAYNKTETAAKAAGIQFADLNAESVKLVATLKDQGNSLAQVNTNIAAIGVAFLQGKISTADFNLELAKLTSQREAINATLDPTRLSQWREEISQASQILKQLANDTIRTFELANLPLTTVIQNFKMLGVDGRDVTAVMKDMGLQSQAALEKLADGLKGNLNDLRDLKAMGWPVKAEDIDAATKKVAEANDKLADGQEHTRRLGAEAQTMGELMAIAMGIIKSGAGESKDKLKEQIDTMLEMINDAILLKEASTDWTTTQQDQLDTMSSELDKLVDKYDKLIDASSKVSTKTSDMGKAMDQVFKRIGDEIGKLIVEGGNWGDTFIKIGEQIAEKLISVLVDQALKQVASALAGVIGQLTGMSDLLGKLFGVGTSAAGGAASGAASAASSATSAGGSAGGGAAGAASGVWGIVGAVGSVVGAIAGIIGDIQGAHDMRTFGQIETNTRETATQVIDIQQTLNQLLGANLSFEGHNATMEKLGVAISSTLDGIGTNITALLNLAKQTGTSVVAHVAGSGTQSTQTITIAPGAIVIKDSGNPDQTARALATMLRSRGIVFDPSKV